MAAPPTARLLRAWSIVLRTIGPRFVLLEGGVRFQRIHLVIHITPASLLACYASPMGDGEVLLGYYDPSTCCIHILAGVAKDIEGDIRLICHEMGHAVRHGMGKPDWADERQANRWGARLARRILGVK